MRVPLSEEDLQTPASVERRPGAGALFPAGTWLSRLVLKRPSPTKGIEPQVIVQHLIPAAEARVQS
jgi:hypothetical protein